MNQEWKKTVHPKQEVICRDNDNTSESNSDIMNSMDIPTSPLVTQQTPHPQPNPPLTQTSTSYHSVSESSSDEINEEKQRFEERRYHYDIDRKTFDFRELRPTDMPSNKHIYLPQNEKNRPHNDEEIELAYLSLELKKATDEFIATHKVEPNLKPNELKGLKKLSKRTDVVIFQTDKSSRFSIDDKDNYIRANEKHIKNDEIIDDRTYGQMLKEINAHSIMWTNFLKAGEHAGEHGQQRTKENMLSSDRTDPPPLYGLRKDHKKYNDNKIGPPTRPVCGASAAHNGKLSHLISMILKEVKRADEDSCESTDDNMAAIQIVNEEHCVESGNKLLV